MAETLSASSAKKENVLIIDSGNIFAGLERQRIAADGRPQNLHRLAVRDGSSHRDLPAGLAEGVGLQQARGSMAKGSLVGGVVVLWSMYINRRATERHVYLLTRATWGNSPCSSRGRCPRKSLQGEMSTSDRGALWAMCAGVSTSF